MVDLAQLLRKLEFATFSKREQLAEAAARDLSPPQLVDLSARLDHPHPSVRLGVIEVLRCANHRDSLRRLLAHAQDRDGDDRVFAIRALAQLARPGDGFLAAAASGWLASRDPFVEAQASQLAKTLALPRPAAPAPAAPDPAPRAEPPAVAPLEALVAKLLVARTDAERLAVVSAIEARGPQPLAGAARVLLQRANADAVAFVSRALIRQAATLSAPERLVPVLEAARVRLAESPIATAAIDDGLLALGGLARAPALLARLAEMDRRQLDAIVQRLRDSAAPEVALHAPRLLDALKQKPELWPALGPLLVYAAADLRDSARDELRRLGDDLLAELRRGKDLPRVTLLSLCWILARVGERGEPLSRHLRVALDRLAIAEASHALCALCARLGTEEAARVVVAMLRDPLPEARVAARAALAAWQSPWVRIDPADEPVVVASYEDELGQPLVRRGDRLVAPASGEDHVLDSRGRPTRAGETEHGGCLCCAPPRALARRRGEGLRCPSSGEGHLREGGRVMLEREHPLGRCRACDSARPRVRDGARIICVDCGTGSSSEHEHEPSPMVPAVPSEHAGRSQDADALPKPPTRDELEHIAPHIRSAIAANVFLLAQDGDARWSGSGIIVARDGNHVAILTNRHVVESDDTRRLCALKALTVAGEVFTVSAVWRAGRGVDLALVEGRVAQPDGLGVMALGTGAAQVGSAVFAIGNPLGLAWSYTAGTLSAIRHWTTHDGQSVRILQTDAPIAPGSSGGGLFHSDGHLLGVMSFLRQGPSGGSAHFALSIEAIREAFARDDVRWHARALADLPAA